MFLQIVLNLNNQKYLNIILVIAIFFIKYIVLEYASHKTYVIDKKQHIYWYHNKIISHSMELKKTLKYTLKLQPMMQGLIKLN